MTRHPALAILTLAAALAAILEGTVANCMAQPANLALAADVSASFLSDDAILTAVCNGQTPRSSGDDSHGAYDNRPSHDPQWLQYSWSKPVNINGVAVYWYEEHRAVRLPQSARLLQWDGKAWTEIKAPDGATLPLKKDTFNTFSFAPVTTVKLRLELIGDGASSTGVLQWTVSDAGNSPAFPPVIEAPPDRIARPGIITHLTAVARSATPGDIAISWSRASGPGDAHFDDPAASTIAFFTKPGDYVLRVTATNNAGSASADVHVNVTDRQPLPGSSEVITRRYTLTSPFWKARVKGLIVNWIPHCIAEIDNPNLKEGGIQNMIEAANKLAGRLYKPHVGYPFANAWVFNTIEAMCVAQALDPAGDSQIADAQAAFRRKLDQWIPIILAAQEPDGYFQTRITLGYPAEHAQDAHDRRWKPWLRGEHEGYVAGYFLEAAIAHHISTNGKDTRLYDAAKKLADCWTQNIGPPPKQEWYDGHEEMEQALFRFAAYVDLVEGPGKGDKYAALARFLLACRGQQPGHEYDQTQAPLTQQYSPVGHAVRAVYLYSAMAAAARAGWNKQYLCAVDSISDNLVSRKMYLTGGLGSLGSNEGFGPDDSLPNNSYCESCAAVGMLLFQHQMNLLYGDAHFADVYENVLYNGLLGGVDLDGRNFTYTNPLDSDHSRYQWHNCPCCVGNIPRALLALPTWTYARRPDGVAVNLFISGVTTIPDVAGADLTVTQTTNYPWDGKVILQLDPGTPRPFALAIRVPSRDISPLYTSTPRLGGIESLAVNGQPITPKIDRGYALLQRTWTPGDRVQFTLPLAVQQITANDAVIADRGRVALRFGPLIYNFETIDQPITSALGRSPNITAQWTPDLLGGVIALRGRFADGAPFQAIPNYARNNRGGRSIVWINQ